MTKRPAIPAVVRLEVFRRDDWRCRYCRVSLPVGQSVDGDPRLTIDHIIPISRGGHPLDKRNLVTACGACNQRKADRTPFEAKMRVLPVGGAVPPGWRAGQTKHPRKIIPTVYAERPKFVPITDQVHPDPFGCAYCDGTETHTAECLLRRRLVDPPPTVVPTSRAEARKMRRAKHRAKHRSGRRSVR